MAQSNFDFLQAYPTLFTLASNAEKYFWHDPNTALIKTRQFAELIAKTIAVHYRIAEGNSLTQNDLLRKFKYDLDLDQDILTLFHYLRKQGNDATHTYESDRKSAIQSIELAWQLAVWFYRTFADEQEEFEPTPFSQDILQVQGKADSVESQQSAVEKSNVFREQQEQQLREKYEAELNTLRAKLAQQTEKQKQAYQSKLNQRLANSRKKRDLDEKQTRLLIIDQQLRDAGWEADSENLVYAKGARPERGKNKAIAEYPCGRERADYVLFCGLMPVAAVEAKKANTDVAGKIGQAERYAKHIEIKDIKAPWELAKRTVAWADDEEGHYLLPFVYSCNGRALTKQIAEKSGTWFRDVRHHSYLKRPLNAFHSPQKLLDMLRNEPEAAQEKLENEPVDYLNLRYYQINAIHAVEKVLSLGQRDILVAMATGTGKTRTIVGLIYRLLKAERFNRILFLVDRKSLGTQAHDTFREMPLEQNKSLTEHYNFALNGEVAPETKVKVATVQAMVKQLFYSDNPPPIDQFDCIIVDEAHRGYTLDQEMTDTELEIRDNAQYLSTYRRVLDYFDAVKIALTATPAKHTTEIFGHPVFTYSYREAVIDDFLVDYEPAISIATALSQDGIHFDKGEAVEAIDTFSGEIISAELEDEMNFDVEAFNKRVINENFNRVVCRELVKKISPLDEGKTLIFCATDLHADMVERILDDEFSALYGELYNQAAVAKITGQSDAPEKLIKRYKNERYPNIAITVDLLTTGIDVPEICNLVFLRRVKSRVLYEQMKGRATRKCEKLGKEVFHIYDAVGLYEALEEVDTMKPIVKDVKIPLDQLIEELNADQSAVELAHKNEVFAQITQKIMRVLRKAEHKAHKNPQLKTFLAECEQEWGYKPAQLHQYLQKLGVEGAQQFFQQHQDFLYQLEQIRAEIGSEHNPILSHHPDEIREVKVLYDTKGNADDYISRFVQYISSQKNENMALQAIINRPRNLTRQQLKEIELTLNKEGFNKTALNRAFNEKTNQMIAAGILAHIRQAALGDALIPFEQRVDHAMQKIYAKHDWNKAQKDWLERLRKQLILNHDEIIDRARINELFEQSREYRGAKGVDLLLKNQLEPLLEEINEALWEKVS